MDNDNFRKSVSPKNFLFRIFEMNHIGLNITINFCMLKIPILVGLFFVLFDSLSMVIHLFIPLSFCVADRPKFDVGVCVSFGV